MSSLWPLAWLAVGIIAAVVEGLTVQLVSIWFALSAAATALATLAFRLEPSLQLMLFSLLGLFLLLVTRPFVRRRMKVQKECTNADMVVGKTGTVTQRVGDICAPGRVTVLGMDWSAAAEDGALLEPGTKVTVKAIDGVKLLVEPVPQKEESC